MKPNVFITGATGNVGGKLVPTILRKMPDATVTLLVRGQSAPQAYERALRTICKLTPEFVPEEAGNRINVIWGDITRPNLGLDNNSYDVLADECTHIIHAAAATKFRMPESQARTTNYNGTRHLADFGMRSRQFGSLKRFAYIGTAYACGNQEGLIPEALLYTRPEFSNVYEQTKWEAEQYLYGLRQDLPLDIFRPSIIVGDSRTGIINDFNVMYVPLKLILTGHIQMLPCRPDIPLDIVPLDYVADVIASNFFNPGDRSGDVFHVVAGPGNEATVGNIIDSAIRHVEQRFPALSIGRVRYFPAAAAVKRLARLVSPRNRAMSIMGGYLPYFTAVRHFDNSNMRAMLPATINLPRFESYFGNLMQYFLDEDLGRHLRRAA